MRPLIVSVFLAAAVLSTAACRMVPSPAEPVAPATVSVSFEASAPQTRAAFTAPEGDSYPAVWQEGDRVKLFLNGSEVNPDGDKGVMTASLVEGGRKATFAISLPDPGALESFNYGVLSPAAAFAVLDDFSGLMTLTIPEQQTASALSPDPAAMLLWAAAGPYGNISDPVKLPFRHLTAYGKLSLTGLKGTLSAVELVSDRNLAGACRFPAQTSPGSWDNTLETDASASQRIRIAATDASAVWFACSPGDWSGSTLQVTATTSQGHFTRTVSFPQGRVMQPGQIARFSVDMTNASGKTDTFDPYNIVFSFGAISDTHINSTTNAHAQKFTGALRQLSARAAERDEDGLDAVVVAGDLTDSPGYAESQTGYAKQLYESVLNPKTVPMIYTVGNHDANPSYWWTSETYQKAQVMRTVLGGDYFLVDTEDSVPAEECRHSVVAGYHILSVTPYGTNPVIYPFTVTNWLDRTLQALTEADPERYVFVNTHPMIENTCYGSLLGTPMGIAQSDIWSSSDSWATRALTDILKKYPQVVTFGGHLHFPLHDPRSIWQKDFTSFGCGSTRYMAIENGKYQDMKSATVMNDSEQVSDGWLIQLDRNGNLRATALDFMGQAVIGKPYEIPYPRADKSHLSLFGSNRAEKNQPPVLDPAGLEMTTRAVGASTETTLSWKRAQDDEFVHHYVLTVSKDGSALLTNKYLADFYLHPQPSGMKDRWTVSLGTLVSGTYTVQLTAYDSWDAFGSCTKSFTVEGAEPIAKGLYADIDFDGGTAHDRLGKLTVTNKGATIAQTTVSHGGKSYSVPALQASASGYVQCQFDEFVSSAVMTSFLREGFSLAAMFVDRDPGAGVNPTHGIFCGTQYGGWGLALRATSVPYFVVGENSSNSYVILDANTTAPKTELTHVVCVYDASVKQMTIYVNGNAAGSKSISGIFYPGAGNAFNRFCLGADISTSSEPDYPCTDMVITDAKFYAGALDAAAVKTAYETAVNDLNK